MRFIHRPGAAVSRVHRSVHDHRHAHVRMRLQAERQDRDADEQDRDYADHLWSISNNLIRGGLIVRFEFALC